MSARKFADSADLRGAQVRCFSRLARCASSVFLKTCALRKAGVSPDLRIYNFFSEKKKKTVAKGNKKQRIISFFFSRKEGKNKGKHTFLKQDSTKKYLTSVQSPSPHLAQPSLLLLVLLRFLLLRLLLLLLLPVRLGALMLGVFDMATVL